MSIHPDRNSSINQEEAQSINQFEFKHPFGSKFKHQEEAQSIKHPSRRSSINYHSTGTKGRRRRRAKVKLVIESTIESIMFQQVFGSSPSKSNNMSEVRQLEAGYDYDEVFRAYHPCESNSDDEEDFIAAESRPLLNKRETDGDGENDEIPGYGKKGIVAAMSGWEVVGLICATVFVGVCIADSIGCQVGWCCPPNSNTGKTEDHEWVDGEAASSFSSSDSESSDPGCW